MKLAAMSERQEGAWRGLLEVAPLLPERSWCVAGGQMVFLCCCEREVAVNRPTDDGDVVLDVRAEPAILRTFTAVLKDVGFDSAGVSPEGHQHRWVRGEAQIDVLIPTGLGERAAKRQGVTGGTTLPTPGAQQALDRSAPVFVEIGETSGTVWRPSMIGALVAKAAAYGVGDAARDRHLVDFAVLASMVTRSDGIADHVTPRDRKHLGSPAPAFSLDGADAVNNRTQVVMPLGLLRSGSPRATLRTSDQSRRRSSNSATSGSMGADELARVLAELDGIVRRPGYDTSSATAALRRADAGRPTSGRERRRVAMGRAVGWRP